MVACFVRSCFVCNVMNIIVLFILQVLVTVKYVTAYHRDYMMAYLPIEEFVYLSAAGFDMVPVPQYSSPFAYGGPWNQESIHHQSWFPGYRPPSGYGGYSGSVGGFGSSRSWSFPSLSSPSPTLPTITSLPPVSLPRPPSVPAPMPSTFPTISTVTTLSDAAASKEPLNFGGKVKASGGVKIYANFC